jgi:hypothetical protein
MVHGTGVNDPEAARTVCVLKKLHMVEKRRHTGRWCTKDRMSAIPMKVLK